MPVFGLHFTYLPMHSMVSIILPSLAWFAVCMSFTFQDGMHMPHLFAITFTV